MNKTELERGINEEEIAEVINKTKNGKTPDFDGLGPEYYTCFKEIFIPKNENIVQWYIGRRKHTNIVQALSNKDLKIQVPIGLSC